MTSLPVRIQEAIRAHGLLAGGEPVVVAVSGGVDSMVLLRLLHERSRASGRALTVAHFNHRLRGRASDADERLVRATSRELGRPFVSGKAEVRKLALARGISLEMAAREARHGFLAESARQLGVRVVALAHHADDQVEHFWMRLLRGSGSVGLAGMAWRSRAPFDRLVTLIRPLLGVTKVELEQFARQEKIRFREDASNACVDVLRNRVRHELLPLLERRYQAGVRRTTLRVMEILAAESEFICEQAAEWLGERGRAAFRDLSPAVQRPVVVQQLTELGVTADFDLVERLRREPARAHSAGVACWLELTAGGEVRRRSPETNEFNPAEVAVDLAAGQGEAEFGGGKLQWAVRAHRKRGRAIRPAKDSEKLDAGKVGSRLVLRHWRAGDRFQPMGMPRPVKLQDLFTNAKVPRAERRQRVVAATADGRLFWVEGLRLAEDFKLEDSTERVLHWHWRREGSLATG